LGLGKGPDGRRAVAVCDPVVSKFEKNSRGRMPGVKGTTRALSIADSEAGGLREKKAKP